MTRDSDPKIRQHVAIALLRLKPAPDLAAHTLELLMDDKDAGVRDAAITVLGQIETADQRGRGVTPKLIQLLDDKAWYVRESAAFAIGKFGQNAKDVVPKLIKLLADSNTHVRAAAAIALGDIGPEARSAAPKLIELLQAADGADAAEQTLMKLAPHMPELAPRLAKLLKERNDPLHQSVLRIFGKMGPAAAQAVPQVVELLNNKYYEQGLAAITLGEIGPTARPAVPVLAELAADDDTPYRIEVLDALAKIGPYGQSSVDALAKLSNDRIPEVRSKAGHAWDRLEVAEMPSMVALVRSDRFSARRTAAAKLCSFGGAAVSPLAALLKDADPAVRRIAAQSLGDMGAVAKPATPELIVALHDEDWHVRSAAAIALGNIGPGANAAVPALTDALKDMEGDVRVCAIESLGRMGPAAAPATAGLIEKLKEDIPAVRSAAARTLGQIGPKAKAAVQALEKLRNDPQDYVREAATEALAAISTGMANKPK